MGLDMYLYAGEKKDHVAYWRKANAIHQWFVVNVQGGEDECNPHRVTRDQLTELRDAAKLVLDDPNRAPELLPSQEGFFFGGTDYDPWYFNALESTVKQIDDALTEFPGNFLYQSSW